VLVNHERLLSLIDDKNWLSAYIKSNQLLDLVAEFPRRGFSKKKPQSDAKIDVAKFVKLLQPLSPRLYSIASSPVEYDNEIHLTIGVLREKSAQNYLSREQLGSASGYLTQRLEVQSTLDIYLVKNNAFRLPVNRARPVIMIGAGTGIAPFRAFLQQRAAEVDSGKNWLVYGNRHFHKDFLYQTEIQKFVHTGLLTQVNLAFSRDQKQKKYVQHCLLENSSELFRWIEEGAHLYVCGSTQMGAAVHSALTSIVSSEGEYSTEQAENYLNTLRLERRYQKDIY